MKEDVRHMSREQEGMGPWILLQGTLQGSRGRVHYAKQGKRVAVSGFRAAVRVSGGRWVRVAEQERGLMRVVGGRGDVWREGWARKCFRKRHNM